MKPPPIYESLHADGAGLYRVSFRCRGLAAIDARLGGGGQLSICHERKQAPSETPSNVPWLWSILARRKCRYWPAHGAAQAAPVNTEVGVKRFAVDCFSDTAQIMIALTLCLPCLFSLMLARLYDGRDARCFTMNA